jgi:RNA polymerase subunit RPABC4/transcription elongation factor Spt4
MFVDENERVCFECRKFFKDKEICPECGGTLYGADGAVVSAVAVSPKDTAVAEKKSKKEEKAEAKAGDKKRRGEEAAANKKRDEKKETEKVEAAAIEKAEESNAKKAEVKEAQKAEAKTRKTEEKEAQKAEAKETKKAEAKAEKEREKTEKKNAEREEEEKQKKKRKRGKRVLRFFAKAVVFLVFVGLIAGIVFTVTTVPWGRKTLDRYAKAVNELNVSKLANTIYFESKEARADYIEEQNESFDGKSDITMSVKSFKAVEAYLKYIYADAEIEYKYTDTNGEQDFSGVYKLHFIKTGGKWYLSSDIDFDEKQNEFPDGLSHNGIDLTINGAARSGNGFTFTRTSSSSEFNLAKRIECAKRSSYIVEDINGLSLDKEDLENLTLIAGENKYFITVTSHAGNKRIYTLTVVLESVV